MTREVVEASAARDNFYASALDAAELAAAMRVEGVDDELAALRVTLREMLSQRPENAELIVKWAALIVRAAGARYRMSARSKDELADAIGAVVRGVGVQLMPEEEDDV